MRYISQIRELFSTLELILIGIILVLLAVVFLLVIYAVILRVLYNAKNRYIAKKQLIWEKILFEYLERKSRFSDISGTIESIDLSKLDLKPRDWIIFGEFIENYLVNLKGDDYEKIIRILWEIGYYEMLMAALDKSNKWVKSYSAQYLGLMKYQPAESKLMGLVHDSSPIVSITAFEALQRIGSRKDLPAIIKNILNNTDLSITKVYEIILSYENEINPVLVNILDDPDVNNKGKRLIVDVLAYRNFIESSDVIIGLAEYTDDTELKIGCIKAIGEFGIPDRESIRFLQENLSSPNWVIRSQSVKALGNIGPETLIPEIENKLLADDNFWVKFYSIQALHQFGEKGNNLLKKILEHHPDIELTNMVRHVLYETEV